MGQKEILILFLVKIDPGIRTIYGLVRHFDRANFPAEMSKSIDKLLGQNLIKVTGYSPYPAGEPWDFEITEGGKKYLTQHFDKAEMLKYVETFDNPKLTIAYITHNC
jgi:hypothetical protein